MNALRCLRSNYPRILNFKLYFNWLTDINLSTYNLIFLLWLVYIILPVSLKRSPRLHPPFYIFLYHAQQYHYDEYNWVKHPFNPVFHLFNFTLPPIIYWLRSLTIFLISLWITAIIFIQLSAVFIRRLIHITWWFMIL